MQQRNYPGAWARTQARRGDGSHQRQTHLTAFDIETVPDVDRLPSDWDPSRFPRPLHHRVVCVSIATARIAYDPEDGTETYEMEEVRSGGEASWDEARLLQGFWRYLADRSCRLVSWNGTKFDMPVLLARSMLHGLDASVVWARGDRWTGYLARGEGWHCDLMAMLSQNGAAAPHGLDEAAAALGLPGKMGQHGGGVAEMVAAGRIDLVRDYCEGDTINTVAVYFDWARLTGRSSANGDDASRQSLAGYLARERAARPHLGTFLDAWHSASRPAAESRAHRSSRPEASPASPSSYPAFDPSRPVVHS